MNSKQKKLVFSRIAPTPSGYLHFGNVFNFVLTWLIVRKSGGKLQLRIDDLDKDRIRKEYIQDIFDTLAWLELDYDEGPKTISDFYQNYSQQIRTTEYQKVIDQLAKNKRLFACSCSRKKIRNLSPNGLYPGNCRNLNIPLDKQGCAIRICVADADIISWKDEFQGEIRVHLAKEMGDFVVRRKDRLPAYQIASLTDDVETGINYIVRGNDLLESTAAQLLLAELLGFDAFQQVKFFHHPLIQDVEGMKLSKSAGASSIRSWREQNPSPIPLLKFIAQSLGMPSDGIRNLRDLLDSFHSPTEISFSTHPTT